MLRRLAVFVVGLLVLGVVTAVPALAAAPTVTSFSPTSGPINSLVVVTGSGFTSAAQVTFNGVVAPVQFVSATKLNARVPLTGNGPVRVTTAEGSATGASFTVTPGVLLAPATVRPGGRSGVSASGFSPGEAVDVYLDSVDTALVVATAQGTLTTTLTAPRTITPGVHWVTAVGRRSGNAAQASLTLRTDWSAPGFDAGHTGLNPFETQVTASTVDGLAQRWGTTFGGTVYGPPVVAGGLVFFHTRTDDVIAVDATTGVQRWSVDLSTSASGISAPVVSAGVVFVGGGDGFLYALTATTGAQRWRYDTGGAIAETPTVSGGLVFVPSRSGGLYAVDVVTGLARWGAAVPGTAGAFPFSPTVVGQWLYVGASDNSLRRMSAATGATGWVVDVGGQTYAAPVVADGRVFAPLLSGAVVAVRAGTGAVSWSATVGVGSVTGTPALVGGRLIASNTASVVTAYDYTSGAVLWTQSGASNAGYSQVSTAGGVAYVSDAARTWAYDVRTGAVLRTIALGPNSPGVVVSDGAVYGYDAGDGTLARFDLAGSAGAPRPSPGSLRPDRSRG